MLIRALKRSEHAGVVVALAVGRLGENGVERFVLRMAAQDAPLPLRRKVERDDEVADQAVVAEAHIEIALAKRGNGIERDAENLGIGGFPVRMAENSRFPPAGTRSGRPCGSGTPARNRNKWRRARRRPRRDNVR